MQRSAQYADEFPHASRLLLLVDALIPAELRCADLRTRQRARLAVMVSWVAVGILAAYAIVALRFAWASGRMPAMSAALLVGACAAAAFPRLLRRPWGLDALGYGLPALVFLFVAFSSLGDGGFGWPYLGASATVPLLGGLLLGGRAALGWGAVLVVWLVLLAGLHVAGVSFPDSPAHQQVSAAWLLPGTLVSTVAYVALGAVYDWVNRDSLRLLEQRGRLLADSVVRERVARSQTEAILGALSEGVCGLDHEARVAFVNTALGRLLGRTPDQVAGQPLFEALPHRRPGEPQHDRRGCVLCTAATPDRAPGSADLVLLQPNRDPVPVRCTIAPVQPWSGSPLRCVVSLRDLTDERRLQAQALEAQKLRSIGELAAGIAHEINTPAQYVGDNIRFLNEAFEAVLGTLDARKAGVEAAGPGVEEGHDDELQFFREEIPRALSQSGEGMTRISEIVRSLKEFSHPGGAEMGPVDLNRGIRSTVVVARNEWKDVARLDLELDDSLPRVPGLGGELNQVVLNLVVNAAQALRESGAGADRELGRIIVRTAARDGFACLEVEDDGPGIPEELCDRIFEPFFTTKPVGKGTGQGLALAQSIVANTHGGRIEVRSAVGEGSTFRVLLPLERPEERGRS